MDLAVVVGEPRDKVARAAIDVPPVRHGLEPLWVAIAGTVLAVVAREAERAACSGVSQSAREKKGKKKKKKETDELDRRSSGRIIKPIRTQGNTSNKADGRRVANLQVRGLVFATGKTGVGWERGIAPATTIPPENGAGGHSSTAHIWPESR